MAERSFNSLFAQSNNVDFMKKLNKIHSTFSNILVSFKFMSLFTNIPINFTTNLLLVSVFDGKPKMANFME